MPRDLPYRLRVSQSQRISPNMQRITLQGQDLAEFPTGYEGGYVKLLFPIEDEGPLPDTETLDTSAKVVIRT
ncbi:MAG: siderophore-interacting protein, partial [Oleispira sp.]|nr:siderophore-interacting protein [Oleispira sp.]